jgi:hypothetical protein
VLLRRVFAYSFAWMVPALGVVICLSALSSAIDFPPISSEELNIKSEPLAPGAPAIILFRQVDRDDSGNTAHENNYVRIKILKEEGRKYADIEIPFFKGTGNNIVRIGARTIGPDGSIVNFDGKVFEKSIAKAKGLKYMAKTFTLPAVQVGSVIEYYYTIDLSEHYIYDSHWILNDELFTKSARFSLKPYTSPYARIAVRWVWHGLPPGTESPKEGPDHVIRLQVSNMAAFQTEDYMPPENEVKARVDFIYGTDFEKDVNVFWKKKGKALDDAVEGFINKRKPMEQAVAQIVEPGDAPEVKLQKIYARVQQIRNTSYEVRKTEQEEKRSKEKDASNVEDVWKRGYGNGVQITWLFLALARAAGFEAYGVMASDRRNYFFSPNTMDANQLDTNVVLIKMNGKDMYFDPGAAFTPFALLDWSETGVQGLRLNKDGGDWVRTVLPLASESRIERKADLSLSEDGDLKGKLIIMFTGLEAMDRRREERNEDISDRKKYLEDEAQGYVPIGCEVDLTNEPDWSGSSGPLVAEYDLKIPGWVSGTGRRAMLPIGLFSATERHVFDHANRVQPIYFRFPSEKLDDVTITLPLGWEVGSIPAPKQQSAGKVILYSLKTEYEKGTIHLSRKLSMDVLLLDVRAYPALRDFFQIVRTSDDAQVVLQPSGSSAKK